MTRRMRHRRTPRTATPCGPLRGAWSWQSKTAGAPTRTRVSPSPIGGRGVGGKQRRAGVPGWC
eukprot:1262603-Alexandrium_andersonii.AAC.1